MLSSQLTITKHLATAVVMTTTMTRHTACWLLFRKLNGNQYIRMTAFGSAYRCHLLSSSASRFIMPRTVKMSTLDRGLRARQSTVQTDHDVWVLTVKKCWVVCVWPSYYFHYHKRTYVIFGWSFAAFNSWVVSFGSAKLSLRNIECFPFARCETIFSCLVKIKLADVLRIKWRWDMSRMVRINSGIKTIKSGGHVFGPGFLLVQ